MLGIAHGQDCVAPALILIAAYALAKKELPFASGLALGAGLFKFHLFVLWPLCLAAQKRWKMMAGFAAIGAIELIVSLHLAGWDGVSSYVQFLLSSKFHVAPEKVVSLWGLLANLGLMNAPRGIVGGVAGAICVTVLSRKAGLEQLFTIAAAGSAVVAPHVYLYDATVLLLPLWLAIFVCTDRSVRRAAMLFSKPYIFAVLLLLWPPFTALPAIVLLIFAGLSAYSRPASWAETPTVSEQTPRIGAGEGVST